ncbi:MAG: hypothetical protein ACYS0G_02685 [Planctomycetota bacterium]|jgi:hypothetical protein
MKRLIPLWLTATAGIVMIVSYFITYTQEWGEVVAIWFDILAGIAFILGGGNILKVHLRKISDKKSGWGYSVILLVCFLFTLTVGLFKIGVHPLPGFPDHSWSGTYNQMGGPFWWLYEYAFKPLTATMFAMLAFYIASAAFRAFRAKNVEAVLLLGTAFIILLGRTFAGVWLTDWISDKGPVRGLRIENLSVYIMQVFNTAGSRAIVIGIALGIASTSLKVILGVDRSYLGTGEE